MAATVPQEEEMKRIDKTIHVPEKRISKLRAQKDFIQDSHDVNRQVMVASERKLPPEMLGEVFGHCLAGTNDSSYHEAQLLLMQVCRQWRRIAASTPSLWTSLILEGSFKLNPCQVIRMGLVNSGALPMTASIFSEPWCKRWNNLQEALQLLTENFYRFRYFDGNGDDIYRALLGNGDLILAPLLESFCIGEMYLRTTHFPSPSIHAPRLQAIFLPHVALTDFISFNPTSLCDVTLHIEETEEGLPSLHFLASCINICTLKVVVHEVDEIPLDIEGRPRLLFPFLVNLSIEFRHRARLYTILQAIEAPALQKLWLAYIDLTKFFCIACDFILNTLHSLFGHNPPLQELHIQSMSFDGHLLASILGRLQNLRFLILLDCGIDDHTLEFLTPDVGSSASQWKCPSLSVLNVTASRFSFDLFLRLVRSRISTKPGGAVDGGRYLQCVVVSDIEPVTGTESDEESAYVETRREFTTALEAIRKSCGEDLQVNYIQDSPRFNR